MQDLVSIIGASFIAITMISMGYFVFSNKKEYLTNQAFFLYSLVLSIWLSFNFLETWFGNPNLAKIFLELDFLLAPFGVFFIFFFLLNFPTPSKWLNTKKVFLLSLPMLAVSTASLFGKVITNEIVGNGSVSFLPGPSFYFYGIVVSLYVIAGLVVLIARFRKAVGIERRQIMIVFFGFAITFSILLIFNLLLQNKIPTSIFRISNYSPIFLVGFTAFAIARYQLFNIKVIATQMLTTAIWLLIFSQLFFVNSVGSFLVVLTTFIFSVLFGIFLIRSVKQEVKRKEELEIANKEITERKEELQIMADKLATANDSLRKLDNAKTEFISIASHQLRTPVTVIKGFTSLILEGSFGELSDNLKGAMEKMYSSSDRLAMLIEDLLNVSRIESGRMQFAFEKASVEKLIKELYDNFLLVSKAKKFYLDLKLPENSLPEIEMDYSKVRELASNFIDNALKYTEKGGVTVKAELRDSGVLVDDNGFVIEGKKSDFGLVVRITVSDTGIGIPKEEIPYLFKKFSRGKDVSRLHVGGTGLGLYVGKAIAEAHHGQVWVESDGAGLGSRFIIEIPVEHVA